MQKEEKSVSLIFTKYIKNNHTQRCKIIYRTAFGFGYPFDLTKIFFPFSNVLLGLICLSMVNSAFGFGLQTNICKNYIHYLQYKNDFLF